MSNGMKRVLVLGAVAAVAGHVAIWTEPGAASAAGLNGAFPLAQATDDTKGKSKSNPTPPSKRAPNNDRPGDQRPVPPSPVLQNAPQSGVPARCASIVNATERQKCMNTPKGQ